MFENIKVFMRGWLGYYGIAEMKDDMERWNEWLRRRIRVYIWKQWKLPRTRVENLEKLGMPEWQAYLNGNTRKGYWAVAGSGILAHYYKQKTCTPWILRYIRGIQVSALFVIEPPCTERYARWCERSASQLMGSLLLDTDYMKKIHTDISFFLFTNYFLYGIVRVVIF